MSSPPRTVSAKKISNKTYAAAASPTRPMVPAVARLSLENTPPPVVTTEPFPPLPKASTETSPLGKYSCKDSVSLILLIYSFHLHT